MAQPSRVPLTGEARAVVLARPQSGTVAARPLTRAPILVQAAAGAPDDALAPALQAGMAPAERVRQRWGEQGREAARTARRRPGGRRTRDGRPEACLGARAGRLPPDERQGWTRPWLADPWGGRTARGQVAADPVRRARPNRRFTRG
jgi:hypothetical protein